ncbi:MAG: GvpL/GvpF family gas vesicle protein [Gemmatimonadaceae bacterium]|nr:GvpL/GvpF family gas vesicle protein [Gemmatimonadaceae bacterium]
MLFAVVARDAGTLSRSLEVDVVSLRDLIALVRRVPYARVDATSLAIGEYRAVVEGAFTNQPVVPVPFGAVFRSRDALVRWMELHYVALREGLEFVHDKAAARVRMVARVDAAGPDFEAAVFDSMRVLTRHAVATVSRSEAAEHGARVADSSFLVDREKWSAFVDAVRDEQQRSEAVTIEQSGPWPAYDFVRLHFGG